MKRTKFKNLLKGSILVIAFALCLAYIPVSQFVAFASQLINRGFYGYISVNGASTSVTKGGDYKIKTAYLVNEADDSKKVEIGLDDYSSYSDFTSVESSVSVKYYDGTEVAVTASSEEGIYGTFAAAKVGSYTVSYSITFSTATQEETTYTYDLKVNSTLSSSHFAFESNTQNMIPSVYDVEVNGYREVKLPLPKIFDEDEKEVETYSVVTDANDISTSVADQLLIQVKGGVSGQKVNYAEDNFYSRDVNGEKEYYLSAKLFQNANYGKGRYYITYRYYHNGMFINSETKEMNVTSDYYEDYELELELSETWSTTAVTGVEQKLKPAVGLTSDETSPASEKVESYYTVKVYYKEKSTDSAKAYKEITASQGTIRVEDGEYYFTPLVDGYYSVVYTVYDFYGNKVSNEIAKYELEDVKDNQDPTVTVYDASETEVKDATNKFKSRSGRTDIVVYAITGEDNVTSTEKLKLSREIRTSSSTLLTINDFDDKNLVFNYSGFDTFVANNYIIRQQIAGETINSNEDLLAWLNANGYKIVVNKTNYTNLATYFTTLLETNGVTKGSLSDTDYNKNVLDFFKTETAENLGFAYLDTSYNFGSSTGTFYVYYIAKDAKGNDTETSRSIVISSNYGDMEMPVVSFPTTLKDSYLLTDKIKFDAPTVSDNNDSRLDLVTMYRYIKQDGTAVTSVKNSDDEEVANNSFSANVFDTTITEQATVVKNLTSGNYFGDGYIVVDKENYTIDLSEVEEQSLNAVKVQILVYSIDDSGNCGVHYQTIDLAGEGDTTPLKFKGIYNEGAIETTYLQGSDIILPSIKVLDDNVSYLTADVKVFYINEDERVEMTVYDTSSIRSPLSGTYMLNGGYFVGSYAGKYQVQMEVVDAGNNRIAVYFDYEVKGVDTVQDPTISTTLTSQTVELDKVQNEPISIPTPSVNYSIANSAVYSEDLFESDGSLKVEYADVEYIVLGVDENGKALDWSTNLTEGTNSYFTPNKVGTYNLRYSVKISTYDAKLLKWVPFDKTTLTGGYVAYDNGNTYVVGVATEEDLDGNEVSYVTMTDESGNVLRFADFSSDSNFSSMTEEEFNNIYREYELESDLVTIVCKDTQGPSIENYVYEPVISWKDCPGYGSGNPSYELTIKPIEANDASGINLQRSRALLSWTLSNGESGSRTFSGSSMSSWTPYSITSDGTYTISYTVYDNNGNYTTSESYVIKVGDVTPPSLKIEDDLLEEKYELGETLAIDLNKIKYSDENSMHTEEPIKIVLTNTTTNEEIKNTASDGYYSFELETAGTYELEIIVKDAVGNETSKTLNFTVEAEEKDTVEVYKVIGIVLIVVSCLILAGVIVYFVIAKVKLDKELKK